MTAVGVLVALVFGVSLIVLARQALTAEGAVRWTVAVAVLAAIAAFLLLDLRSLTALGALTVSLSLRLHGARWSALAASVVAVSLCFVSPAIAVVGVAGSAVGHRHVLRSAAEAMALSAVLVAQNAASVGLALVLPAAATSGAWLAVRHGPLPTVPSRHLSAALAWFGAAAGLVFLLALDDRRGLVPANDPATAMLLGIPAAFAGAAAGAIVLGGRLLAAVSDAARPILLASLVATAFAALVSPLDGIAAILPAATLAAGAGASLAQAQQSSRLAALGRGRQGSP